MYLIKKYLAFFVGVLMVTLLFNACKTSKSSASTSPTLDKSLLWQISGPGIEKPSYLFGTIHLIPNKDFFLPKGLMSSLDASKKVVFEIDMKEMTDMSSLMSIIGKVMMKDNKTLKDLILADEYKLVEAHFKKIGLPLMFLERMKPMVLTVFASGDMDPAGLKNGSMKSYEMELNDMAKDAGKETGGLETIDFQLSLFDSIPYEAQAKMLVDAIKGSLDMGEDSEYAKMIQMYLDQDINAMIQTIKDESHEVAGFEDKLLSERNKNWIPQIIAGSKVQPTLYAVGAGHLAGKNGVIQLLRNAGMKVTPIK